MGGDAEARTRTVRRIHGIPHEGEDSTGAELAGKAYREGLVELVTFVVAFGCAILLVLYCYRAALCFGARCGWRARWRRSCVDGAAKRAGAYRLLLAFTVVGVVAASLAGSFGEAELLRGVKNVGDAVERLGDWLEHLRSLCVDMVRSTGTITRATKDVTCSGEELDKFVGDVAVVNATIGRVSDVFDAMIDPVRRVEDQVRSRGRFWVTLGVRLVTFGPSIVYVFPMFFGLLGEGRCKSCAIAVVEGGACCSSCIGLPVGLALFAVLFVLSIGLADFCFLGPAAVLTGGNEDNRYLAYYLRCEGSNPISVDVDAMANAVDELDEYADELELAGVCTGLDAAASDIDGAIGDLQDVVDEITEDVLSCRYIQPIVGDLFYDAVCDRTVEGLYRVWVVVLASGAAALCGLFVAPLATAAFRGADHRDHDRELRRSYLEVVEKGEVVKVRSSLQRAVDAARGSLRRAKVVPIVAEPLDAAEAPPITAEPVAAGPPKEFLALVATTPVTEFVENPLAAAAADGGDDDDVDETDGGDDDGLRAEDVDDADEGNDDGLRADDVDDADSDRGRGDDDHTDSSSGSANDSDDYMDEDDERNLDPVDAGARAAMVEAEQARLRRMDGR